MPPFFDPDRPITRGRNRLPHWEQTRSTYFVTFRLADSIPHEKLRRHVEARRAWEEVQGPRPWAPELEREYYRRFHGKVEAWLDLGSGDCLLGDPENAAIVEGCLRFFEGQRQVLHAWVVMPNHVHVLFELLGESGLPATLKAWKGYSARRINERLGRTGPLWQRSYFDRLIRDWTHFGRCVRYVLNNPAKARVESGRYRVGVSDLGRRFLNG